jgi:hypothetical protein
MKSMTQDCGPRRPTRWSKRLAILGVCETNRLPDLAANAEAAGWVLIEKPANLVTTSTSKEPNLSPSLNT